MGPADKTCHEGQAKIATIKTRDRNDEIFVQEKLDGSNVGIAKIGNALYPLSRAGWLASSSSSYEQHRHFSDWVYKNYSRFWDVLKDGERLVGEWLMQAHGTRYNLQHEPFVAFDLMVDDKRMPYDDLVSRLGGIFTLPALLHRGNALGIEQAIASLNTYGFHGAIDPVEGAVWRIERNKPTGKRGEKIRVVDFLVKFVRPDKVDGFYLPEQSGMDAVWNWYPNDAEANRAPA